MRKHTSYKSLIEKIKANTGLSVLTETWVRANEQVRVELGIPGHRPLFIIGIATYPILGWSVGSMEWVQMKDLVA